MRTKLGTLTALLLFGGTIVLANHHPSHDRTHSLRHVVALPSTTTGSTSTTAVTVPPTTGRASRRGVSSGRAVNRPAPATDDNFARLARCESALGNDSRNGRYHGYFQFDLSTWYSNGGGPGDPHTYSYEEQLAVARTTQARRGWSPWPVCSRKLGLR